jgi:hypothetical protein
VRLQNVAREPVNPPEPATMKTILSAVLAGLLLYTLPWGWSALAGIVAGLWSLRGGWLSGGLAVAVAWAGFVVWNYIAAPAEVDNLMVVAGAFTGVPGWLLPVASIGFGFALGAAGGFLGSSLSSLLVRPRVRRPATRVDG